VRPGELFAMRREDIDRAAALVYLHETADRMGRIQRGPMTTHHFAEKERRGAGRCAPRSCSA
jgi:hypothetical protein